MYQDSFLRAASLDACPKVLLSSSVLLAQPFFNFLLSALRLHYRVDDNVQPSPDHRFFDACTCGVFFITVGG